MLGTQVQILFVALCWSAVLVEVGGAPREDELMETVKSNLNEKNITNRLFRKFMSELMAAPPDEVIRELEEQHEEEEEEEEEEMNARGREAVMRRHLSLAQRERKAGCRNFFWKTFTSC